MVAAISSTEAEVSSDDAACSDAPWLSCSELAAICSLPDATLRAAEDTSPTTDFKRSVIRVSASTRSRISSLDFTFAVAVKSPSATARATPTAVEMPRVMLWMIQIAIAVETSRMMLPTAIIIALPVW
ncbi:hypothetical protein TG4357_02267 [Thalassovita gelatinovora]|uniref:Uncharacterized protein n=1 Tax=Thalassovita gelatinovora TaxID=53501 RepID=A0A0P1FDA7_THAGE|nr:hypothetical protein TG4357_02267 [Thalassovita gelatinovora]